MAPNAQPMTLTQKILCHHAVGLTRPWVAAGDVLRIRADWTIASELAWNGMNTTYDALGRPPVHDRERFYLALDHTVDPGTLANDKRTQKLVADSETGRRTVIACADEEHARLLAVGQIVRKGAHGLARLLRDVA